MMNKAQKEQNPANVLACTQRCLAIEPDLVRAHIHLICALHDLGRLDEELKAREKLAALPNFEDRIANAVYIQKLKIQLGITESTEDMPAPKATPPVSQREIQSLASLETRATKPSVPPSADTYIVPSSYKDLCETDFPHLSVNDLIVFSMQAQNDFDHQSAAMFINERLKKRPGHFGDMIRLQKIHMKLGHYLEALQIL